MQTRHILAKTAMASAKLADRAAAAIAQHEDRMEDTRARLQQGNEMADAHGVRVMAGCRAALKRGQVRLRELREDAERLAAVAELDFQALLAFDAGR